MNRRLEPLDQPHLDAWKAFLSSYRSVLDRLEAELRAEQDLPLSWYDVLLQLREAPDGVLPMKDLAAAVLITPSGVTRLVDRMEAEGLVERRPCPSDRRVWWVALTPAGRRRLRAAAPVHLRGIQEHFARHLDADEAKVLTRILGCVAGAVPAGSS